MYARSLPRVRPGPAFQADLPFHSTASVSLHRTNARADPTRVIAAARGWLGTPYHDQASVKGVGCDCLGLVRGVWRELYGPEPLPLPPYSRDWGETGTREPLAEAARRVMLEIAGDRPRARRADPVPDARRAPSPSTAASSSRPTASSTPTSAPA